MEKKWPPLESCPQYVSGLISPFVSGRFSWEDDENIQDWYAQYGFCSTSKEIMDSDLQATKKFLHEMRATRAYGYETVPRFFDPPLRGPGKNFTTMIEETTDIILAHISERTGRPYELVEVVKFLWTEEWLLLLTIEAKESVPDSVTETFLATVSHQENKVLECFLKPDDDAPTEFITPVHDHDWNPNTPYSNILEYILQSEDFRSGRVRVSVVTADNDIPCVKMNSGSEPPVPFQNRHRGRQFLKIVIPPNRASDPTISITVAGHTNVPMSVRAPVPLPLRVPVPTRIIGNSNVAARSQIVAARSQIFASIS